MQLPSRNGLTRFRANGQSVSRAAKSPSLIRHAAYGSPCSDGESTTARTITCEVRRSLASRRPSPRVPRGTDSVFGGIDRPDQLRPMDAAFPDRIACNTQN